MINLAAEAVQARNFDEIYLRLTLGEISGRSYEEGITINQTQSAYQSGEKPSATAH